MKANHRVLVVDDEPQIRSLFKKELNHHGFVSSEADCHDNAIALLRQQTFDVVLLDVLMPTLSGLDSYDVIRSEFPAAKIIISSVYPYNEQLFMIFDADDYYCKLDSLSTLIEKINKVISRM